MQQITFEESKFDEIIRLVTKDGWYKGNAKAPADLPNYLLEPRGKTTPGIPSLDEEITAYRKGYAEGMAARQEGKTGPDNPYSHDNVLLRLTT
jgi:hypothetical protein